MRSAVTDDGENMTTKDKVLEYLKESGAAFISGQQMAKDLDISRAAVWKAIKNLQSGGFNIEAVTNKGYRLVEHIDMPDGKKIKDYIDKLCEKDKKELNIPEILVFKETGSTNDLAKKFYEEDNDKELIIIAGSQTKGKGRRGRKFYSPDKTGLYISFLIHPELDYTKAILLTCMMAVAACRAIEQVTNVNAGIKWVNDIFCNEKKVAGILAEGSSSIEDGRFSYVVIGTGINLFMPYEGFPEEIKNTAGSVLSTSFDNDTRNELYATLIYRFFELYRNPKDLSFVEEYKNRSVLIGNYVKINSYSAAKEKAYAKVIGIDDECRLIVEYDNKKTEALSSGEVSVVKY